METMTTIDKAYELLRRYNKARDDVNAAHATNASKATLERAQFQRDAYEGLVIQAMSAGIEPTVAP